MDDASEESDESENNEMTPFEISENFRNLKINIMMVKGKLKEIREKEESSDLTSIHSQIEAIEEKFSASEEKREENKKIILSLIDKFEKALMKFLRNLQIKKFHPRLAKK